MLTSTGFDQEKSVPDNANETQSTGVPVTKQSLYYNYKAELIIETILNSRI